MFISIDTIIITAATVFSINAVAEDILTTQIEDAISNSDYYTKFKAALIPATKELVEKQKCSLPVVKKFRGWKLLGDKFMIQCGSFGRRNQLDDRWYLDPATGRLYQTGREPISEEVKLATPPINASALEKGDTQSLKTVTLPWGESLFDLLQRKQWRFAMHQNKSPSDFFCDKDKCHLELHLVGARDPKTTKNSCGLLFRWDFDRHTKSYLPVEWRAARIWEHKEDDLTPFFRDRYATSECGTT